MYLLKKLKLKLEKVRNKRVEKIVTMLIDELDGEFVNHCGVKHLAIYFDYCHMEKRDIEVRTSSDGNDSIHLVFKTNKVNTNYKKQH